MNENCLATLRLHESDNVVVARRDLEPREIVAGGVYVREAIPAGHKIAVMDIASDAAVIKYASPIGIAARSIGAGTHVHTHNVLPQIPERAVSSGANTASSLAAQSTRTFRGYVRPDGRIATRNYIGIVTTVNCSASVARLIANSFTPDMLSRYEGVDGIVPLVHTSGCAMSKSSEGFDILRRTLAGYATHPNFAGVLVLGLGCEQNQTDAFLRDFELAGRDGVESLVIQDAGGTTASVAAGRESVQKLLERASGLQRQDVPASHLKLALECGGSDGYSGISANPALGVAADLLVAQGGTVVLSETPEIVGAEHVLTSRAASADVARELVERVEWWREHTRRHGVSIGENPSEGNRKGGITTVFEKSLGAVAKAGTTPLMGVFGYARRIDRSGLVFMDSPGYDPVAVTGQVAAGCNIICFTTGRGSVFGCRPVPSLKLSTNTALYERMRGDIDLDCGTIVDGRESVFSAGQRVFEQILASASGAQTCSEKLGFGADEFVPWQLGATL